jgi:phage shock protein PspC (stress-responsive transcriptional regulator)
MIAGVVGGLANYFGIDSTLARVLYVVGSILSAAFPGALVYVIMWAIVPKEGEAPAAEARSVRQHQDDMRARRIVGFHTDQEGHWVAELECGHTQHVRHEPPLASRPWVVTEAGRKERIGTALICTECAGAPGSDAA